MLIKSFQDLMEKFAPEELVTAWESIMTIFGVSIKPYVNDIIRHFKYQYIRFTAYNSEEKGEAAKTAKASFLVIKRILIIF